MRLSFYCKMIVTLKLFAIGLFCVLPSLLVAVSIDDLIPTTPEEIADIYSDDSLVSGIVSPLGGQVCLKQTDLVARGAHDVVLSRTYLAPFVPSPLPSDNKEKDVDSYQTIQNTSRGWIYYPHHLLERNSKKITLKHPSGAIFAFRVVGGRTFFLGRTDGICNVSHGEPSGKYDLRNIRITIEKSNKILVHLPDGTVLQYSRFDRSNYLLEKEICPNGKILKYFHDMCKLTRIESRDPLERYTYASIDIDGVPKQNPTIFTTNLGQKAIYQYKTSIKGEKFSKKKKKSGHSSKKYGGNILNLCSLASVESPFYRHEKIDFSDLLLLKSFSGRKEDFRCDYEGIENQYKISKLSLPSGKNNAVIPVYTFQYNPPKAGEKDGHTTVTNIDGTKVIYHFNKNLLKKEIQYFDVDGKMRCEKVFQWNDSNRLEYVELLDSEKKLCKKISYAYDSFGNPNEETITGDLTGQQTTETCKIWRKFSDDGRNLMLKETHEEGLTYVYQYLDKTNLVTTKLTQHHDKILKREFFKFDDSYNLIQKIHDDGTSISVDDLNNVTERIITTYKLRQTQPFLHMPEWIETTYLENGFEKLLSRTHLNYDAYGNINKEDFYDSDNVLAYSLIKEYNERGDLISETNPLGQKAIYSYDAKGLKKSATLFSSRQKTMTYNARNCLSSETDETHSTSFDYDENDRLKESIDYLGSATHYDYDLLFNKISKTEYPKIISDGQTVPVISKSIYDSYGQEVVKIDPNGNQTLYKYNAYGNPIEITHPNGFKEQFVYTKSGKLKVYIDQEDRTTTYTYDPFGRVKTKNDGYACEKFEYNAFHLIKETDGEGYITTYSYDGAGRKISEARAGKMTKFGYDSLGYLSSVTYCNENNTIIVNYKKDFLDRICEIVKTDQKGNQLYKISYTYDDGGNRNSITRYFQQGESVELLTYDIFNRLKTHTDGCGNVTELLYNEQVVNPLGQKVLEITTMDPANIRTIETKDPFDRLVRKEVRDNGTLSLQERSHDPCGNLIEQTDYAYSNYINLNTHKLRYKYNSSNEIESFTRAFGTPDARTTSFSYTPSGNLKTKTLPDSTVLTYTYDPQDNLETITSDDNTLKHRIGYNKLGYLLNATDEVQNLTIKRDVDPFGNILRESYGGFEIVKTYDKFDRPLTLTIPQIGKVKYLYDPLYLRSITRLSSENYTHSYISYDADGKLLEEELPYGIGKTAYTYDLNGRLKTITSPHFAEEYFYNNRGNLIRKNSKEKSVFDYNGLSQLISETGASTNKNEYDSTHNLIQKNGQNVKTNSLNEWVSNNSIECSYDLNGNLSCKKTQDGEMKNSYDHLNRLTEVVYNNQSIRFTYDPLGRRLSKIVDNKEQKTTETYLYDGQNEIAAFEATKLKQFRVLGDPKRGAVAIELGDTYIPINDVQGNVRQLLDSKGTVVENCSYNSFGIEQPSEYTEAPFNPWRYASKRIDPETGLVYFGHRYYDSEIQRWFTTDPAGFTDSINLYQYLLNNPYRYNDPDGQFLQLALLVPVFTYVFGETIAYATVSAVVIAVGSTAAYALADWGLRKLDQRVNDRWGYDYHALNNIDQTATAENETKTSEKKKGRKPGKDNEIKGGPPRHPTTADYLPDPNAIGPHTTLGEKTGRKNTYLQGATFDENGKFEGRTDVTDHGRGDHQNPHYHPAKSPNGTVPNAHPIPEY